MTRADRQPGDRPDPFARPRDLHPVDRPDPGMVQILAPDGTRTDHPDFSFDIDDDGLCRALEDMVMARRLDLEGTNLQRHGELSLWPPLMGQEATQVGAHLALGPDDQVFPTYREQALAHLMGVSLADILAAWRGTAHSCWDTRATHVSAYPVMIGSGTLHAVGYAMGIQRDRDADPDLRAAVLDFHGDGGMSEGDTNEAYVFAASMGAPVVFCCVNNQWAISEPTTVQSPTSLYRRALGFGIPAVQVDGNDVIAVAAVLAAALERARNDEGPLFVEAWTYRRGAHTTTDDPTRYRTSESEHEWELTDPIERLRHHLQDRGVIDDQWMADLQGRADEFGARVRAAVDERKVRPLPELLDQVYVDPPAELRRQKEELTEWLALGDPQTTSGEDGEARR